MMRAALLAGLDCLRISVLALVGTLFLHQLMKSLLRLLLSPLVARTDDVERLCLS